MLGLLTISSTGPVLLLVMWGGVVADRVNRLKLMTFTRAMFSLQALLTGVLVAFEVIQPWHLIAISLFTGILLSFDIPSRQAILPNLVEKGHLLNAIVLYSFIFSGAAVIGPMIFVPMVSSLGMDGLFFYVGITYALTVVTLLMMTPMPAKSGRDRSNMWEGLLDGLSYIRGHRVVLSLIGIVVVAGIFGSSFGTLLPVFAAQILEGGLESYGLLLISLGVGGLTSTVALALFGNLKNLTTLQLVTGVGFGLGLAVFSRISWLPASVAVIALVGGASAAFAMINNTLLQSIVDDEFRGRVMSIHQLGGAVSAVGGFLMGLLAEVAGAPFALGLSGLVTAIAIGTLALSVASRLRAGSLLAAASFPREPETTGDG
jgi:MFS family permease